ncbi:MAG: HlyD family efflux transporter periplasmic adaptor subunit, partial [Planctomycetes bacterium]|nr:HlyD family efflux transporter periplasmic adaptor subunit [Planctomycetota bacterium]
PALLLVAVIGGAGYAAVHFDLASKLFASDTAEAIQGAPVRRGNLHISEVVRGNLEASDSIELKVEIEGGSKITFLAEEGIALEKGDLIAEFDTSRFEEDLVQQEITVNNSEAAVVKAQEQLDIQAIQNQSDIAAAELQLELAQLDLEKYTIEDGEWTNELAAAEESIVLKEEKLARASKELEWTRKLYDEGFVQRDQLEGDELLVRGSEIEVAQARRDLELKKNYGNRRRRAELEASVGTKEREIDKVQKQARSRMADYEASLASARYKLNREKQKLEKLKEQISGGQMRAPEAGLLVYSRGRWGETIKEGDDVWNGSNIGTIPRSDSLIVTAGIHETKLKKIKQGMPCSVTTDAFPGLAVPGVVEFVAIMASESDWRRGSTERSYKATIKLDHTPEGFRPGMSCNAEILIQDLTDVLYVPRQCVLYDNNRNIVFVDAKPEPMIREVEVGLDNNNWVEIRSGLKEGETVLLSPPATFKPTLTTSPMGVADDGEAGEGTPKTSPAGKIPAGGPPGIKNGAGSMPAGAKPAGGSRPGGGAAPGSGQPSGAKGGGGGGRPAGAAGGGGGRRGPGRSSQGKGSGQ